MKGLKRFFAVAILDVIILSCAAFAYPGLTERNKLSEYFHKLCSSQKLWDEKSDEWSDMFDKLNKTHDIAGLPLQRMYKEALEKFGRGNCRFGCVAVYFKLQELGFENYQTIILLKDGNKHFSNLYRNESGEWLIADLSAGIGFFKMKKNNMLKLSVKTPLQAYVNSLGDSIVGMAIRNTMTNETSKIEEFGHLDIRTFIEVYKELQIPFYFTVPEHFCIVRHPENDRILLEKIEQVINDSQTED
ncbi:MAG: hypothetical protein LBK29_04590 [Oscillospiraceae bacterium]|jgi:hypothetical protein|nr:hypothetical protein [Oscillospiraceae bacterium]